MKRFFWSLALAVVLVQSAFGVEHLKQSTAVTIKFGPFVDAADGVTAEGSLTLSQADFRLSKNGGNIAQKNDATAGTHDELGFYDVPLDATDTNTLGRLLIAVSEAGALPVWKEYMVLPANAYDSLYGSDKLEVNVTTWNGTAVASPNTAGYPVVTVKDGTGTGEINTASGVVDANVTQILGEAVDASPTPLDVNVTQVLGTSLDDDIAFGGTFEDTIAENISMFFGSVANFGSDSAAATTISDVNVSASAILDDTGTSGVLISSGTGAGQLNLSGGRADANVLYFGGSVGTFSAGIPAVNVTQITDGTITAAKFGAGAINAAAIAADAIGASELATDAAAEVAGAAWNVTLASHVAAGSTGEALNAAGAAGDPWTTTLPGSYTGSQAGKIIADILDDTGTSGVAIATGQTIEFSDTELRAAIGLAAANLDTQLDALPTAAENTSALLNTVLSDTGAGEAGRALYWLYNSFASDGVFDTASLANAPAGGGGSVTPIAPTSVLANRTWRPSPFDGSKAENIVTLASGFIGTLAVKMPLNPDADIDTFDSVTITGAATVTATTLTKTADGRTVHFDVPELTTTGTYTVTPTVTTLDGQTIPMTCTLVVR